MLIGHTKKNTLGGNAGVYIGGMFTNIVISSPGPMLDALA